MTAISTTSHADRHVRTGVPWGRIVCAATAAGTLLPFTFSQLTGDTGAEITAGLVEDRTALVLGTYVAILVAAGLFVAAVRLGRSVSGATGALVTAAGVAVALTYAGYYSSFGAGAILADPETSGPGLGESAWLVLNVMELTRFAPGLALAGAAALAGRSLRRGVRIAAGVLAVMTLVPLTSWVAALLIPVWLGVSAALVRD